MPLIVKIILLPLLLLLTLSLTLSALAADKTQYFVQLNFNSTLQLINCISGDIQKLLQYFNGIAIVVFLQIPFSPSATVVSNELALYSKHLKLLLLEISASKLVATSLE